MTVNHSWKVLQHNAMVTLEGVTQETTVVMETASQGVFSEQEAGRCARAPSFHPRCFHPVVTAHVTSNTQLFTLYMFHVPPQLAF